jgi:hypothetical protein
VSELSLYHQRMMAANRELLAATRNAWVVTCYEGGNRRQIMRTVYVRAADPVQAEEIARRVSRQKVVSASPWNPVELRVQQWIQRTE